MHFINFFFRVLPNNWNLFAIFYRLSAFHTYVLSDTRVRKQSFSRESALRFNYSLSSRGNRRRSRSSSRSFLQVHQELSYRKIGNCIRHIITDSQNTKRCIRTIRQLILAVSSTGHALRMTDARPPWQRGRRRTEGERRSHWSRI